MAAGALNAIAAAFPASAWILDAPPYLALVGAILLAGMAGVAVRAPASWREWRTPGPMGHRTDALEREFALPKPLGVPVREALASSVAAAGYRVAAHGTGDRWALHGTRRGWSRFAALGSHLAFVLIAAGAALGSALASETVFSLLPGDQALLDEPRPGFTSSVRLDDFDAEFDASGRPLRLDASVTFLRGGQAVESALLRVNEPGSFDGYLVHGWTYGPAARVRVEDLSGRPLADAPVPLDGVAAGRPAAFLELPTIGITLGLVLTDADRNQVLVSAANASGPIDSATLRPGEEQRLGSAVVRLTGFDAYVTFMSRSDPGIALVFGGSALLVGSLAVAYYFPRRRLTLRAEPDRLLLTVRGERFESPEREVDRLVERLTPLLAPRDARLPAPGVRV